MDNIIDRIHSLDVSNKYLEQFKGMIDNISLGNFTVSFSAIKEFSRSPLHFLRYKISAKKTTDAMEFGTLLHLLILEPHLFSTKYIILTKAKGFEENTWSKKENTEEKLKIENLAIEQSKTVVTMENLLKALDLRDSILSNSYAGDLIRGCNEFEKPIKFDWNGFKWNGYIDAKSRNYILDLKKVPDANPNKLKWQQVNEKWHLQAFLYLQACNMNNNDYNFFYNICYDESGAVTVIRQTWISLESAKAELIKICSDLNDCIIGENWHYSYEFYTEMGFYNSFEI